MVSTATYSVLHVISGFCLLTLRGNTTEIARTCFFSFEIFVMMCLSAWRTADADRPAHRFLCCFSVGLRLEDGAQSPLGRWRAATAAASLPSVVLTACTVS